MTYCRCYSCKYLLRYELKTECGQICAFFVTAGVGLIANGKKSSIVRIYGLKTMVVMALQLMGLFSFRVKVCVEADISHLIQHLFVSRLSIF